MNQNKKIVTSELEFDEIKQNLRTFLQGQSEFSDYDFEGSGLSVLLDILAYNTHYNALYTNLAVNEAFLDSASKRASVVSKAKEIGYLPASAKCATATVSLLFVNEDIFTRPDTIEVPRGSTFISRFDDRTYNFYTQDTQIAYRDGNEYRLPNIVIKEGTPLEFQWVASAGSRFIIPNQNVDLSTLRVIVQDTESTTTFNVYKRSDTLLNVDNTSLVYFVKELEDGLYEIEFGNDVIGKSISVGNVIAIDYMVSSGSAPNGARTFRYGGVLPAQTTAYETTIAVALGGAEPEAVDSIKWNAPRSFAAQNRAVTLEDYKTVIKSQYPNARSVNVWGGESNNPPAYGDVFISVQPEDTDMLTEAEKNYILNDILGPRRLVTVHPKFVDPTYISVELTTSFYYDPKRTFRAVNDLTSLVREAIINYNDANLNQFGGILKYSALSRAIDGAEESITNSITTLRLHREVPIQFNQAVEYLVDLGNPIYNSGVAEDSIISTGLNVLNIARTVYIDDLPTQGTDMGVLRMFYWSGGKKVVIRNVGTVQYSTGIIKMKDVIITGMTDISFKFIIKPQSNDIASIRNQIVGISPTMITITPLIDTTADKYTFTSSRN